MAAVVLVYLTSACVRPLPPPPGLPPADPPSAPLPVAGTAQRTEPFGTTSPVTLKPTTKPKSAAPAAAAASSLGGHDRHLVLRPLDPILAADFELGALAGERINPALRTVLEAIEIGLMSTKLPYDLFSDKAAAVARIIYPEGMLQGITTVRFAEPRTETGGIASVGIRILALRNSTSSDEARYSATGLAILAQGEAGIWKVEHFELDLEALAIPLERSEIWDPYSTPLQY